MIQYKNSRESGILTAIVHLFLKMLTLTFCGCESTGNKCNRVSMTTRQLVCLDIEILSGSLHVSLISSVLNRCNSWTILCRQQADSQDLPECD